MRIALLHPSYWPEVRRGAERLVHDVAAALAARGHDVTLLTSHRARTAIGREDGFQVVRSYRPPTRYLHRRGYEYHLTNVPTALRRVARGGYDLAHAFFLPDAWAAVRARAYGGPPVVLTLTGIPTREFIVHRRLRMEMLQEVALHADAVTVLSEAAAAPFRRYLFRDPDVVPPGVSCPDFAVDEPRTPDPTLICAASLNDRRKRIDLVVRAFARLRERRTDARLLLAGTADPTQGEAPLELPAGAARIDAGDTPSLARAYARSWASVLAAEGEGFGLVLAESLAAGTPAVAARSGASAEVIRSDEVGRLFNPGDEADLARAMDEALELGSRPGTVESCRAAAREWDWSCVLPRYEDVYDAAIERAGGAKRMDATVAGRSQGAAAAR